MNRFKPTNLPEEFCDRQCGGDWHARCKIIDGYAKPGRGVNDGGDHVDV
jgi:hypothetical protein